jgi:hypothetical protein
VRRRDIDADDNLKKGGSTDIVNHGQDNNNEETCGEEGDREESIYN